MPFIEFPRSIALNWTLTLCFLFITSYAQGQYLSNGSFEGPAKTGTSPPGWIPCKEFSTPDTQPSFESWNIDKVASNGISYLGLVTRGSNGFINDNCTEAAATSLSNNLLANKCYRFSINLSFFADATFTSAFIDQLSYGNPTRLNIWASETECERQKLLWRSPLITNEDWITFTFSNTPEKEFKYVILEVDYNDINRKTNGNILIDNLTIEPVSLDLGLVDEVEVCQGVSVILEVSGESEGNVNWSTGENTSSIVTKSKGMYWVNVSKNGCVFADTTNVSYSESKECCTLQLPNVFTPNGDLFNEGFKIKTTSNITFIDFKIFNRWGNEIFKSDRLNSIWNGKYNNEDASTGIYYWQVYIQCEKDDQQLENSLKGDVAIVR